MLFDIHSDLFMDVDNRRAGGSRSAISENHSERLKEGGVTGMFAPLFINPYQKEELLHKKARSMFLNMSAELNDNRQIVAVAKCAQDFLDAAQEGKLALMLGSEGLCYIGEEIALIELFYQLGMREVSLTWNEDNALASGAKGDPGRGLTQAGAALVKRVEELGMILDVSHINEKSFWDIAKIVKEPIMASHSNSYTLCPHPRNLKDDQLAFIREIGGVVGLNAYPEFVQQEQPLWNMERLADHMDYMIEKMGIDHVALGFDFADYMDEEDAHLSDFYSARHIPKLLEIFRRRGYTQADLDKITHENILRVIRARMG